MKHVRVWLPLTLIVSLLSLLVLTGVSPATIIKVVDEHGNLLSDVHLQIYRFDGNGEPVLVNNLQTNGYGLAALWRSPKNSASTTDFTIKGSSRHHVVNYSFSVQPGGSWPQTITLAAVNAKPTVMSTMASCVETVTMYDGATDLGWKWTDVAELHNSTRMYGRVSLATGYKVNLDVIVSFNSGLTWSVSGYVSRTASNSTTSTSSWQTYTSRGKTFDSEVHYTDYAWHTEDADVGGVCERWIERKATNGPNGSFSGSSSYGADWVDGNDSRSYTTVYNYSGSQRTIHDGCYTVTKDSSSGTKNGWEIGNAVLNLGGGIGMSEEYYTKVTYDWILHSYGNESDCATHYAAYADSSSDFGKVFYWTNSDH